MERLHGKIRGNSHFRREFPFRLIPFDFFCFARWQIAGRFANDRSSSFSFHFPLPPQLLPCETRKIAVK